MAYLTAVWKAINQLKDTGYEIEAVQNKGYHLVSVRTVWTKWSWQASERPNGQARKRIILIRLIPRTRKQKNWQKKDIRPELCGSTSRLREKDVADGHGIPFREREFI